MLKESMYGKPNQSIKLKAGFSDWKNADNYISSLPKTKF